MWVEEEKKTVAGYRSILFFCRIIVDADFSYSIVGGEHQVSLCVDHFVSYHKPPYVNQSIDRYLPFERVLPLEMTEIFFFLFVAQTGATSHVSPSNDLTFFFLFLFLIFSSFLFLYL